ncbi:MAG: class II aldolase/adducin family protein, partial [Anaerolineae bacterium]|nr:class II aldolase/adducin family protein [Anaerolineae bacterium]
MMENEHALRARICQVGRLMHQFQWVDGVSGNISARLDAERLLVTPSGHAKGFMTPNDLLIIDLAGQVLAPLDRPDLKPTSEILMHLEVYHKRPDVGGVVHAHPPNAVALSIAGISVQSYAVPETLLLLGEVPTTPYAT